ncbi:MAG: HPF/RaiA family ribosome-associated protein [bacterium]|nr:HPF/RaiA family ribosome-associated protein [bacterium]
MKYTIKTIHLPVSITLTKDVERKIVSPLKKILGSNTEAISLMVELLRESRHHRKGSIWTARLNLSIGKNMIRIEQSGEDIHEAVDLCAAQAREDVKKFKERSQSRAMRGARKAVKDMKYNKSARTYRTGRILNEGN